MLYITFQLCVILVVLPQSIFALYDFMENDRIYLNEEYFAYLMNTEMMRDETAFYLLVGTVIAVTGFFLVPLIILVHV